MTVLAYHLTWTTYGSWLSGDPRCWVQSGLPGIQDPDPERHEQAHNTLAESAVSLGAEQRAVVEKTIRDHCRIRGWTLHAINVRSHHVHVVVSADRSPEDVMNQFKAWCSRRLSDQVGLGKTVARKAGRRRWWTEHGSTKWINDEQYLHEAIEYVLDRQGT